MVDRATEPSQDRRSHRQVQPAATSYQRPAVLVVDNVGYLPLDRAEANILSSLVSSRYERGNMIVTSNKSFATTSGLAG